MTEWRKVKFLEVVQLNPRVSLTKGEFYPFVEMSNAPIGSRYPENDVFQTFTGGGSKFEKRDTVIARIEPCLQNGKGFLSKYDKGFGSTEFLVFRPVNEEVMSYDFLYYFMGQQTIREAMAKTMVGASGRQRVNNAFFNDLFITLPSLPVQRRIAEVLSRYDALIENYQRQIKLLEEAAQRLYKEWFVDLRFPGHQSTPIINNLPQSWQKKKLGEIARLKAGGDKPKVFSSEKTFELTIPVYSNGTINEGLYGYTDTAEINVPCVTISARGSVGYTVLRRTPFVPIVRLISVIPDDIYVGYLFFYIKDMPLDSNGAAQQQITVPMIKDKEIIIPENGVLNGFRNQVEPFFITVDCLKRSIRNLSEARDRLLPKLMSAEIEV